MTEPTLKLDGQNEPNAEPPLRSSAAVRWVLAGVALAALFAGVVLAMLLALPRPHSKGDFMIAGGLATMITLLAFFGALVTTQFRGSDSFYKRRQK